MPFFDTHWRLRRLAAVLAAVAAVLLPLWYLQVAAAWDHLQGLDMLSDDLFAGGSAVVLLGVAFLLERSAQRSRERLQWRLKRLSAAIHRPRHPTLQRTPADPTAAAESITIALRIGTGDRVLAWLLCVPFFIVFALGSLLVFILVVGVLVDPTSFRGETTHVFVFLILVPAMAFSLWVIGTWASEAWTRSSRYELDPFGITWMRSGDQSVTICWQDTRLLEEAAYYRPEGRRLARRVYYLLYGNDTVIRMEPQRSYSREMRQLLALVKKHSGLVPRQFNQPRVRQRMKQQFRHLLAKPITVGRPRKDEL